MNEWSEEAMELKKNSSEAEKELIETIEFMHSCDIKEEIPDEMPKTTSEDWFSPGGFGDSAKEWHLREKYIEMGMFGFVSWRWVNPLAEWIGNRKCLEVMAGRGWLSYALQQKGIDVKATDNFSWHQGHLKKWKETVTDVENIDAVEAVETYGADIDFLLISWAYMDDTAYRVIEKLHEVNPDAKIIYIGEGYGGCTANNSFFDHIEEITHVKGFNKASEKFQSWWGIHDRLQLGQYRP